MIGVYGGTFDPVHFGHLRTALEVKEALTLDEVRFIPCRQPPHRQPPLFSASSRLRFLQAAVADEPGFTIDRRELDRSGPSYMFDTLTSLRRELGKAPLCLILGQDAFLGLPGWYRWQKLIDLVHFIVMDRPGYAPDWPSPLQSLISQRTIRQPARLREQPGGGLWFQKVTHLEISGTLIRQCLQGGQSPRYLLPDPVLAMIRSVLSNGNGE